MIPEKPLIAILGPTAVGKSDLAIDLAQEFPGEIVSADSRLVYRGMNIGTAKPSRADRGLVPHHLIDIVDPGQVFSVAEYQRLASQAIGRIHARGKIAYLVGGTGQYLRAVLEGWQPPPRGQDRSRRAKLRQFARENGPQALHDRLREVDPKRAQEIHPNNVRRVIRALEIYEITGQPPSELQAKEAPPYDVLQIGLTLSKSALAERIEARVDRMLEAGLVEEVQSLMQAGVSEDASAMSAIGYSQIVDYLLGNLTLDQAREQIVADTLDFLRRQTTWFKADDPEIEWFEADGNVGERVKARIRGWLSSDG